MKNGWRIPQQECYAVTKQEAILVDCLQPNMQRQGDSTWENEVNQLVHEMEGPKENCNAGYKGDMNSMKSTGVEFEAQMRDRSSCLRFDFQGQGLSNGSISLSSWLRDSITMLDSVCGKEKQVLVGSSIGAWLALHIALQRPHRVKSMVLIAPAVDITGYWWAKLSEADRQTALAERRVHLKTQYQGSDEYLPLHFYQDGEQLQLLNGQAESIDITCPIRILHGMRDTIVPYSCSTKLLSCLKSADVHLTLIKDGDHQLSRPQDLSSMLAAVQEMEDY